MVEQPDSGERHHHVVVVRCLDDKVIADRSAGLGYVLHAASERALDVVSEREECVGTECNVRVLVKPCALLLSGKYSGLRLEDVLPFALGENVHVILADVEVDRVVAVGAADRIKERKVENLLGLAQPPVVRLRTCETRAVDAGLLSGTDTDRLAALAVAHGVGLRVLEGDQGDDQVDLRKLGKVFVLRGNVREQLVVDLELIAALLERDAVHLLVQSRYAKLDANRHSVPQTD